MFKTPGERVLEDLQQVIHDAEELLQATTGFAGEKVAQVRTRTGESLQAAKARLAALKDEAAKCAATAAERVDTQVRANPWASIGMGAAAGLLVGLLLARRDGR